REVAAVMALAEEETERQRRRFGMSRREFVRTAAAYSVGLWAIDQVFQGEYGSYAWADNTRTNQACDLEWPGAQMRNLPGEFIFDVQSHHVDSDGEWRATNPGFEVAFSLFWSQAGSPIAGDDPYWPDEAPLRGGREVDPMENLSRYHYLKELFLDSSTNVTILSAVPSEPRNQPLPIDEAAITIDTVREMAGGTPRSFMHAFVMPNRGWYGPAWGSTVGEPLYLREELDMMEENVLLHRNKIRGWKVYTPWGSVPYTTGWFLDGEIGLAFLNKVRELGDKYGIPKTVAAHKGFALPAFDERAASPRDVGPAARQFPDINFLIYHSGYDGGFSSDPQGPYPGDANVDSSKRGVDCLVKSLRENNWDASRFVPRGLAFGNSPNVYAEIGSLWRDVMRDPDQAAHALGKLIRHVGPRRVVWGTDSLWYGSPQSEIVALRAFRMSGKARELYGLPYGLDGDRFDPRRNALSGSSYVSKHPHVKGWPTDGRSHPERTIRNGIFGRNAAPVYGIDPEAKLKTISCDRVQVMRDQYLVNEGTPRNRAPMATNRVYGLRTRRDVIKHVVGKPWSP
ncbi:MAG: amidohydrolase, partial [Actinobacteria bacterium]|nr:amidohydrolase [Actinomycetota bacterium]